MNKYKFDCSKKSISKRKKTFRSHQSIDDAQSLQRTGMPAGVAAKLAKIPQGHLSRYGC